MSLHRRERAGTGSGLVRHDPTSGKKEVVVPTAAFVPEEAEEPLKMEAYESRVLNFTNSQRVWRRNTRGDYWLLDVAARELGGPRRRGRSSGP